MTLVSINDSTLLLDRILIFWSHQEILDGIASFKVDLLSMFDAYFFQALTQPFIVWYHHVWFLVVVVARVYGNSSMFGDLQNNRRFSLRCVSQDITPVNIRLKSSIKTPKTCILLRGLKKTLLNERIRSINNTINMLKIQKDTCINQLKSSSDEKTMEECVNFIILRRESRHIKTLERQILKFE